jgi:hypothetical protein
MNKNEKTQSSNKYMIVPADEKHMSNKELVAWISQYKDNSRIISEIFGDVYGGLIDFDDVLRLYTPASVVRKIEEYYFQNQKEPEIEWRWLCQHPTNSEQYFFDNEDEAIDWCEKITKETGLSTYYQKLCRAKKSS